MARLAIIFRINWFYFCIVQFRRCSETKKKHFLQPEPNIYIVNLKMATCRPRIAYLPTYLYLPFDTVLPVSQKKTPFKILILQYCKMHELCLCVVCNFIKIQFKLKYTNSLTMSLAQMS